MADSFLVRLEMKPWRFCVPVGIVLIDSSRASLTANAWAPSRSLKGACVVNTITVEALRTWLEEGRPVTILDVRPTTEHVEWSIPGSLHRDAYYALKARDPEALTSIKLS